MLNLFHMSSSWGSMEPGLKKVISLHLPDMNPPPYPPSFCFISGKLTDWVSPFRGNPTLHWCVSLLDVLSREFLQNPRSTRRTCKAAISGGLSPSKLHMWIVSAFISNIHYISSIWNWYTQNFSVRVFFMSDWNRVFYIKHNKVSVSKK